MKTLMFVLILFPTSVFSQETEAGPGWIYVTSGGGDGFDYYIQFNKVQRSKKGVLRAWVKSFPPSDRLAAYRTKVMLERNGVGESVKGWTKWAYLMSLWEINCEDNTFVISTMIHYDFDGSTLETIRSKTDPTYVVPESVGEALLNAICKANGSH